MISVTGYAGHTNVKIVKDAKTVACAYWYPCGHADKNNVWPEKDCQCEVGKR